MSRIPKLVVFVGIALSFIAQPASAQGTPVPGKIELEDYTSFFDLTPGNEGVVCRSDDVDLTTVLDAPDGGCTLGWTQATEWVAFQINAAQTDTYVLSIRVAHPGVGGTFHVEIDGVNVTGSMTVPDTGDWGVYRTIRTHGITVTAGEHALKLVMDSVSTSTSAVGVFNYLMFTKSGAFGGIPRAIPGTIQTEDFDVNPFGGSGQGFAYHDTTPSNLGGFYRLDEAVDIAQTADGGDGFQVGWTERAEWLGYTVNIQQAGVYEFRARVAHPGVGGTFHVEIDGQDVTGPITIPDTGGWTTWQTIGKATASLPTGQHVMYIVLDGESSATGALANVNYFELLPVQIVGIDSSTSAITVDQVADFWVLASYFDWNDVSEAELRHDFDELRRVGVHGVRLMANWWNQHRETDGNRAYAGDTLIQPDGTIDLAVYGNLVWVLDRAREYSLWVDLSFSAESVAACAEQGDCLAPTDTDSGPKAFASLTAQELKAGILDVVNRLKLREQSAGGRIHGNVVIDIQNESTTIGPMWQPLTQEDTGDIVSAVKALDPQRLVFADVGLPALPWEPDPIGRVGETGQDIFAYHDERVPNWWTQTESQIQSIRARTQTVIYMQEPERYREQEWLTTDGFLQAVCNAKRFGATAWTFHSTASFHMNQSGLFGPQDQWNEKLKPVELEFLEQVTAKLQTTECQRQN